MGRQLQTAGNTVTAARAVIFCPSSRTVQAPFSGYLRVRIGGSGGSGASGNSSSGGNGGTVAFAKIAVAIGDSIVVALGSGGPAATNAIGNPGGVTTVTGPNGLNASVPGGRGGVLSGAVPAANAVPTGVDIYWLGGSGGAGGGGSSGGGGGGGSGALLEGATSGFAGGSYISGGGGGGGGGVGGVGGNISGGGGAGGGSGSSGSSVGGLNLALDATAGTVGSALSETHSRLLINVSGGGSSTGAGGPGGGGKGGGGSGGGGVGGFGGGGGGASTISAGPGGAGGICGGGGACGVTTAASGVGGNAYVTLEFMEA